VDDGPLDRGPVLVATDGAPAASGALRFAHRLEHRRGLPVVVVSVFEPIPLFEAGLGPSPTEPELHEERRGALEERVRDQLRSVRGSADAWPLEFLEGPPARRITERAREVGARLVVVGRGRGGVLERVLGGETALRVVRLSDRPVVAVPEELRDLPRTVVAGVDFSPFSERAVRATLPLLRSPARLHLLHVAPPGGGVASDAAEAWAGYRKEAERRLALLERSLSLGRGGEALLHLREGRPGEEVLALAEEVEADLVTAGSHGHSFVGRLLLGSVSTRILRSAPSAVLVAPPGRGSEEGAADPVTLEEEEWIEEIRRFVDRHRGRTVSVELHDPELGLQQSSRGLALGGADYDAIRDRLVVVVGREESGAPGVTHTLPRPRTVERREGEGEEVLRVTLPRGELLLRADARGEAG